ncbi:MAG: toll/interleukin-1 receptor domain-containing protein [Chitinophagaceae bacterium]|nr:toll/interleukin-1 receptor domain-containing protein [Chitinophagaceae bacterium]
MPDIFISYKREDKHRAGLIAQQLESSGWTVWWDHDLLGGEDYDVVIERELNQAKCVIVIWSPLSVQSRNVKDEARKALGRNVLLPITFDHTEPPIGFGMTQVLFFENSDKISTEEYHKLFASVERIIPETGVQVEPPSGPGGGTGKKRKWLIVSTVLVALIIVSFIFYQQTSGSSQEKPIPDKTSAQNANTPIDESTNTEIPETATTSPGGNGATENRTEWEKAQAYFKDKGTEMLAPMFLDTISYFRIKNMTANSVTLEVDYFFNLEHGMPVYLGAWLWKENDNNFSSGHTPVALDVVSGKSEITITLSDIRSACSSDGFIVFLKEPYKAPFTARIFRYQHNWSPPLSGPGANIH